MTSQTPPPVADPRDRPSGAAAEGNGHPEGAARDRIKALIFDFDGVLADTADDIADAANAVLRHYRMPAVPKRDVRRLIGGGAEALIHRLLTDADDQVLGDAAALFKQSYRACYDRQTRLYPGVSETLRGLRAAGMLLAIATNKVEAITDDLTRKLMIHSYFVTIVGPESVTRRKPDPEAIQLILDRLGIAPGHALMVGDTGADIVAGKRAGTFTCGALYGYGTPAEIAAAQPDFAVSFAKQILGLLRVEQPRPIGPSGHEEEVID